MLSKRCKIDPKRVFCLSLKNLFLTIFQADLRSDPLTVSHLSKTGRAPVSQEQALAICCEIEALHYVETSARTPERDNAEAFEVCAMAAIKYHNAKNNNNNNNGSNSSKLFSSTFKRSPSINSTVSLFEPQEGGFKRSPSTHSSLSLSANTPTSGRMAFPFPMRKNVPQLNRFVTYAAFSMIRQSVFWFEKQVLISTIFHEQLFPISFHQILQTHSLQEQKSWVKHFCTKKAAHNILVKLTTGWHFLTSKIISISLENFEFSSINNIRAKK